MIAKKMGATEEARRRLDDSLDDVTDAEDDGEGDGLEEGGWM